MCQETSRVGWMRYNTADWHLHYVPLHPECFVRTMTHPPAPPQELAPYGHWWEGMEQMSWWDKFWSGYR